MAMEKPSMQPTQRPMLLPGVGERKYSHYLEDFVIVMPSDNQEEGVSVPIDQYPGDTLKLFKAMGEIASRDGLIGAVNYGDSRITDKYGSRSGRMADGAGRNQQNYIEEMKQVFQVDELISAGFEKAEVEGQFKIMSDELRAKYFGPGNENKRARKKRSLRNKIAEQQSANEK